MENEPLVIPEGAPQQKRRMVKSVLNALAYVVILVGITVGIPKFLAWYLDTPFPMATITSGSMWPVLKEGDLVFIQGVTKKEDVEVGDVIVFRNNEKGTFTIHRIVSMGKDDLTTQGDANFTKDAPVKYGDVVGKTFKVYGKNVRIPLVGFVTMYASSKVGAMK